MENYWETHRESNGNLSWVAFKNYDVDDAIATFDPSARGAQDAISHTDKVDGTKLTDAEIEMVNNSKEYILNLNQYVGRQLENAEQYAITVSDIGFPDIDSDHIKMKHESKLKNLRTELKSQIKPVVTDLDQSRKFLNYFRFKNDLRHRPAVYPEDFTREIGLLAILLIAEAIINSIFFAHGSDLGLLGGWVEALLVSLANVSISFVGGFMCLRYAQHSSTLKKWAGVFGFIISVVCLFFLHLATAHYREMISQSPDANFIDVISSTINNPFGITDLYSLILILIGVVISIYAYYKGINFDDHYPGYGKTWRRFKKLDDNSQEKFRKYRQDLELVQENSISELEAIRRKIAASKNLLNGVLNNVEAFMNDYDSYASLAKIGAETLVSKYRYSYQQVLRQGDEMAYREGLIPEIIGKDYVKRAEELKSDIKQKLDTAEKSEKQYQNKYDSITANIQKLTSNMSDDKELEKVEKDVLRKIKEDFEDIDDNVVAA